MGSTCAVQVSCYREAWRRYNQTKDRLNVSEAARKASYLSSQKIHCYLNVFEVNDTSKPTAISHCEAQFFNVSKYDIQYPDHCAGNKCFPPRATHCQAFLDKPCDVDWVSSEYESQSWYTLPHPKHAVHVLRQRRHLQRQHRRC